MAHSHSQFGPSSTPQPLKYLIWITVFVSLFTAVTNHLIPHYLGWISPEHLFSLSTWGIEHLFFWQFLTYLFVQPIPNGLSFSFLLSLAFNAYILWVIGASLIERKGLRHFFILYFLSGLLTGFAIYSYQLLANHPFPFAGNTPVLYTLLLAWLVLFPTAEFLLFMVIPIRASWLILSFLSINLLIDLSTGDIMRVIAYITAAGIGYLYGLFLLKKRRTTSTYTRAKKFDFKTGKAILNDDEFLNEMLTKIWLHGKSSLTIREKLRLHRIHKNKKK